MSLSDVAINHQLKNNISADLVGEVKLKHFTKARLTEFERLVSLRGYLFANGLKLFEDSLKKLSQTS